MAQYGCRRELGADSIAITAKGTNNPQLPEQIGDSHHVYTNELIDDVNNFDKAAIVKQAREFRL